VIDTGIFGGASLLIAVSMKKNEEHMLINLIR